MADLKYYDIIQKPLMTEKSIALTAEKKYTFIVHPKANKIMIKEAVEKMFDQVKVDRVNTMIYSGKPKRRGQITGRTNRYKKAIVTLSADSKDIDVFGSM